jgi:hypothetical protein
MVRKIPTCAAAPSSTSFGLESMVEKSVMAPIPRNIRGGIDPLAHSIVDIVKDTAIVIHPDRHPLDSGDVPHNDTKSDGKKEKRLVFIADGEKDKHPAHQKHHYMPGAQTCKGGGM